MQVRCLHCHEPTEVADGSDLGQIVCTTCGGSFSILGEETAPYFDTRMLGRFELLEQVGTGTFGAVWKARDPELDRLVAIKVPRKGQLPPKEAEKFLREARAAAQLKHPSIVGVHEVGRDGDTIYIVSDFVAGATLDDWLTSRRLTPREAATLCATLADALEHAHQAGVIHRDLKPGNVMMDFDGRPHLMDFGLARRLAGEATMTVEGRILGTPAYMSPEQARGAAHEADARSDVYSLGVILFKLLTGELPFRGSTQMLIVQILNDEPPSPRQLNHAVPRDLETICLKALAKEPARRYQAASELGDDLRHFLKGEPIQARPVGRIEQAGRWVRKRPAVATLALALVLVVLGSLAGLTTLWLRADEQRRLAQTNADEASANARREEVQRRRAETNFQRARGAVDQMLSHVGHERLRYVPQMERLRRELLEEALRFNEGFLQERGDDVDVRSEVALAHDRLGHVHEMLGQVDKAEQAYRRAHDALHKLVKDSGGAPEHLRSLTRTQRTLANLLDDLGRHPEAEKLYRDTQALSQDLVRRFPDDVDYQEGLSLAHHNLAMLLVRTGRSGDAEKEYRLAIDQQETLATQQPSVANHRRQLANSLDGLGSLLDDTGRPREAEKALQQARSLLQKLTDGHPTVADFQWELARTEYNLGVTYQRLMQYQEAEGPLRRSIALKEKLVANFPSTPDYRRSCAMSHKTLALLLQNTDRRDEAEKHYARAIALQEKLVADFPRLPAYRAQLADAYNNRSMLLLPLGRLDEAEQSVEKALSEAAKLTTEFPKSPDYASTLGGALHNHALILIRREQWAKARSKLEEAIPHQQRALATNAKHPTYREFLRNHNRILSDVLLRLGERQEAELASRQAIRIVEDLVKDYPGVAEYRSELGATLHNLTSQLVLPRGELVEARQLLETAIDHQKTALQAQPKNPTYRAFLRNHWWKLCDVAQQQREHRAAAEAAAQLPLLYPDGWEEHLRAAALVAKCLALVETDPSLGAEQRQELVDGYAGQALALLKGAAQNGFNDKKRLGAKDFEPLHGREEFQKLQRELK